MWSWVSAMVAGVTSLVVRKTVYEDCLISLGHWLNVYENQGNSCVDCLTSCGHLETVCEGWPRACED